MAESGQNQKNIGKTKKSESLGWDPPLPKSLEILLFLFFLFFGFVFFLQGF